MLQEHKAKLLERRSTTVTPSSAATLLAANPAATRAGAELRGARERLGWNLADVANGLRIHPGHLEALEHGDTARLPGDAYAVGYVRAYSMALGLDPKEMIRRFKAADIGRPADLVFPAPMPDRRLPAGAAVLLGLLLSIGAYVGWYRLSGEGRLPAEVVAAIPERLASLAEQAQEQAHEQARLANTQPANTPPSRMAADPADTHAGAASLATMTPPLGPTASADPSPRPPPVGLPTPLISPTSAAAASLPDPLPDEVLAPPPIPPAVAAPVSDESRLVVHASADSWIQVKDRNGTILLNRTMKAGETWPVPRPDLLLTTGNAGGTDIQVDGATTASLGGPGIVRRDLPLDLGQVKDAKRAAVPPGALPPPLASVRARQ